MTERPSFRSRQALALRREIVAAAMELFVTKGFEETTIEDIAERVGISSRTVFRHYTAKEDIVLSGSFEAADRLRVKVAACDPALKPLDCIHHAYIDFSAEKDGLQEISLSLAKLVATTPRLRARALQLTLQWEEAIVEALMERGGITLREALLVAAIALTLGRVGTRRWLASNGKVPLPQCIDEAFVSLNEADLKVSGPLLPQGK